MFFVAMADIFRIFLTLLSYLAVIYINSSPFKYRIKSQISAICPVRRTPGALAL